MEQNLKELFEESQAKNPEKLKFSEDETNKFKKAFEDPEFRKLFADYMDEMQDPKNREENEMYINQLEGEKKVPQGKELIKPEPGFVAKSHKIYTDDDDDYKSSSTKKKEKIFLNIVSSPKITEPSKAQTPEGTCWSLPYSVGPPHMEKDKSGENAPAFDCCFHPETMRLSRLQKEFKDLLVHTAMEGVEEMYSRQNQGNVKIHREFHILKGIAYKDGQVPTMMIATASKDAWKQKDQVQDQKLGDAEPGKGRGKADGRVDQVSSGGGAPTVNSPKQKPSGGCKKEPAIKKGFLTNNSKKKSKSIYPEAPVKIAPKNPGIAKRVESATRVIHTTEAAAAADVAATAVGGGSLSSSLLPDGELKLTGEGGKERSAAAGKGNKSSPPLVQEVQPRELRPPAAEGGATAESVREKSVAAEKEGRKNEPLKPASKADMRVSSSRKVDRKDANQLPPCLSLAGAPTPSDSTAVSASDSSSASSVKKSDEDQSGLERPEFTVVERGQISMGDFEALKAKVASNRPSELVYKIFLPKIKKSSHIVLDVSERNLKLSYPEVYSLSIDLPYPVNDKKGAAKYDKASKSLSVTLPVKPFIASLTSPPSSTPGSATAAVSSSVPSEDIAAGQTIVDQEESTAAAGTITAKSAELSHLKTAARGGHGRWVADGASSSTAERGAGSGGVEDTAKIESGDGKELRKGGESQELSESAKLKAEVMAKAEEARRIALAQQQQQQQQQEKQKCSSSTIPPAAKRVFTSSSPSSTSPPTSTSTAEVADCADGGEVFDRGFYPSAQFAGARTGYVFKRDSQGVGYYIDAKQQPQKKQTSNAPPSAADEASPSTSAHHSDISTGTSSTSLPGNGDSISAVEVDGSLSKVRRTSSFPLEVRQTLQTVAVLVQVPHILQDSVKIEFASTHLHFAFSAYSSSSSSSSGSEGDQLASDERKSAGSSPIAPTTSRSTRAATAVSGVVEEGKLGAGLASDAHLLQHFGLTLKLAPHCFTDIARGGFEPGRCEFDVAGQNMVIVLKKREEIYWEESVEEAGKLTEYFEICKGSLARKSFFYLHDYSGSAEDTAVGNTALHQNAGEAVSAKITTETVVGSSLPLKTIKQAMSTLQFRSSHSEALFELD